MFRKYNITYHAILSSFWWWNMPNYCSYYFQYLVSCIFQQNSCHSIFLNSNLLFLKNVKKIVGSLLIRKDQKAKWGVYKCHKCVPIVLERFYLFNEMIFRMECIKRNVLYDANYTHTNAFITAIVFYWMKTIFSFLFHKKIA